MESINNLELQNCLEISIKPLWEEIQEWSIPKWPDLSFEKDLTIRKEIDRFFRESEIEVNILSEFDNIETIKQALGISSAVSILPRPSIVRDVERGLLTETRLRDVDLKRPVGLICRRGRDLSATAREFLDFLMGSAERVSGSPGTAGS